MSKNVFDFALAFVVLMVMWIPLLLIWGAASLDTRSNGWFRQKRIGQFGTPFVIYKIKTMRSISGGEPQFISVVGAFFRKTKLDELPQLINILKGEMSFVGPRPELPGYYDLLEGEGRKVLALKPGLTSEASLKYYNEMQILAQQENPLKYTNEVIFPDKVRMNLEYLHKKSFVLDLQIIFKTALKQLNR